MNGGELSRSRETLQLTDAEGDPMTLFVVAFFVIAAVISILWLMVRPRANEPVGGSAVTRPGTQIRPLRIPHSYTRCL